MIPTIQSSTHGRWTQQHDLDLAGSLPVQGSVGTSELPSILPIDQHDRARRESQQCLGRADNASDQPCKGDLELAHASSRACARTIACDQSMPATAEVPRWCRGCDLLSISK